MSHVKQRKMACDRTTLLPGEIIVHILEDEQLGFSDVCNFGSACKHLHKIVNNDNKLWMTKFFQRWPRLREVYRINNASGYRILNWKEEVKASLDSRAKLLHLLSLMSTKHYKKSDLSNSDFKEYDHIFHPGEGNHHLGYYFLIDELISLIKSPIIASSITNRYYARKVLRYLKQCHLKKEWQKFIALPEREQTLERGTTIVAQWFQPEKHIPYLYISSLLDSITDQIKELLKKQHPAHSIFSTPAEQLAYWKNNILGENQWSVHETKQVVDALCEVLFHTLGFFGNSDTFYYVEHSFIDYVLEHRCGTPTTLAIVFESIARRLGIHCEPVIFPSHFLLRWKETYGPESKDTKNFYIDILNGGQFLTKKDCPGINGVVKCPIEKCNILKAATATEVVSRVTNNLQVAMRHLGHFTDKPRDFRLEDFLSALEFHAMVLKNPDMPFSGEDNAIIVGIPERSEKDFQPDEEIKPKHREPGVKYAVGLIMKHKEDGCLCVITGWDSRYKLDINEVDDDSSDQPFYYVLVDDGSLRYTAQENLCLAPNPGWIDHHAIGKYFNEFNGIHYIPNDEEAREYPEDGEVCKKILSRKYSRSHEP